MIQNLMRFFLSRKKFLFSIFGLLLLFLGRPSLFPSLSPITAICGYAFLWTAVSNEPTKKKRFFSLWILFFLSFIVATFWLSSHPFTYIYAIWILCAVTFSLPFALASTLLFERNLTLFRCCSFAALFTLIEISLCHLLCGFPFLSSALFFSGNLYSLQLASIIGAQGLTFLVFLTNILTFHTLQTKKLQFFLSIYPNKLKNRFFPSRNTPSSSLKKLLLCPIVSQFFQTRICGVPHWKIPNSSTCLGMLIILPYLCGSILFWHKDKEQSLFNTKTPLLSCAIAHMEEIPDIFSPIKRPENLVTNEWLKVFPILKALTPHSVSLIILPEGVIPYPAEAPLFFSNALPPYLKRSPSSLISSLEVSQRIAKYYEAPLILGLEGRDYVEGKTFSYNSCFFVSPDYHIASRYDKQLLLPFGEYIPSEKLRTLLAAYGVHGSFSPGKGPRLFVEKNIKIAPLICYEESFSSYVNEAALLSPTLFVSMSNDSWFPSSFFGREHFELARLRVVESGIPLVRSCNKGVSGAFDALGRTIVQSEGEQTCLVAHLSQYHFQSVYTNYNYLITVVFFALLFFIFIQYFFSPKLGKV